MPPLPTTGERQRRSRTTPERGRSSDGAAPLTQAQLNQLMRALQAARDGDFSVRLRPDGALGDVASAFNALVERNQQVTKEFVRIGKVVGREGRINERAAVAGAPGAWADKVGAVNELIDNLARPTIEVARVIDAVADGDLSERIQLQIDGQPVRGEFRRIGTTVNGMVDQLSSFADEVTRVAREVGTEGKLGGQAQVKGVSGTWKDLTDSVNQMASNLTGQVRNIAEVTTAVATGDLSKKVTVDVKGEVLELKNTVNTMVDQLSTFADEVTRVAREVGSEGKLGGQDYAVARGGSVRKIDTALAPPQAYLHVLGTTGLTAYFGLFDVARPKPGDTVVVSGAAGAVGQVAGQLAKIAGCRAVGIAGGAGKVADLKKLYGYDAGIDYKADDVNAALKETCPRGVDVYFDNVGGALSETVFRRLAQGARIAICGQISQYNLTEPELAPRNLGFLIVFRARMEGFLVSDYAHRFGEGMQRLGGWLAEGRLHHREDVTEGLENAPRAFIGMLQGENRGKTLVKL